MEHEPIERIKVGKWKGRFATAFRSSEWSAASRLNIIAADWQREWPQLVAMIEADQLDVLKRDPSGDVLATQIPLAGVPVDVILKRPKKKNWRQSVAEVCRTPKAVRAWQKAMLLRSHDIPAELPLAVFRRGETIAVYERVPGVTLEQADLDQWPAAQREQFFLRCGQLLRRLEDLKLAHTDAKSSNWIVFDSPTSGPTPVLIDAYGIRWLNPWLGLFGLHRLLRAMKNHPQYTPLDSKHICQGFAPEADLQQEEAEPDGDIIGDEWKADDDD